jgi:predicted metalloendopeptidase
MDTDFSQHQNRYTFSKSIKRPDTNFYKRDKTTKKEKVFATNVAVGMGAVKSYMDAFSELDSYKAGKKAAILLRQERVMKEVEKSVVDVAKSLGVDHEYVLTKLKCLVDNSPEDNIVLNAVKEIGKAIGTIGGITVKHRETGIIGLFQGFEPDQL